MKNYIKFILDNWKIYILGIVITIYLLIPLEAMLIFIIYGVTENLIIAKMSSIIVAYILIYTLFKVSLEYINYESCENNDMYIYKILITFPFFIIAFLFPLLISR